MKAAVYKTYGPPEVLRIEEVDKPAPGDDEVLVKVKASSINPVDWYLMTGLFIARIGSGLTKPRDTRLGVDFAGIVEAVGKNVVQFAPGDAVFGARSGALAEYVCVRGNVYPKPAGITFEQAAGTATAAITALQGLRDYGRLKAGQSVLINGAAGGVGTFAVQIAREFGADVTGVCSSRNLDLVRSLGAHHVIDYTREDFTRCGRRWDLLLDIAGSRPWRDCRRVLSPNANFVIVGGPKSNRFVGPLTHVVGSRIAAVGASQKVKFFVANFKREDFSLLIDLLESGKVNPFVERIYPLSRIAEAMHYLGTGHARGKLIISLE